MADLKITKNIYNDFNRILDDNNFYCYKAIHRWGVAKW